MITVTEKAKCFEAKTTSAELIHNYDFSSDKLLLEQLESDRRAEL